MTHWKTTFDPDDGEPIGELCYCDIGEDHDGRGDPMFPEPRWQDEFGGSDPPQNQ
jgi:hypothetical protein